MKYKNIKEASKRFPITNLGQHVFVLERALNFANPSPEQKKLLGDMIQKPGESHMKKAKSAAKSIVAELKRLKLI